VRRDGSPLAAFRGGTSGKSSRAGLSNGGSAKWREPRKGEPEVRIPGDEERGGSKKNRRVERTVDSPDRSSMMGNVI